MDPNLVLIKPRAFWGFPLKKLKGLKTLVSFSLLTLAMLSLLKTLPPQTSYPLSPQLDMVRSAVAMVASSSAAAMTVASSSSLILLFAPLLNFRQHHPVSLFDLALFFSSLLAATNV